MNQPKSISFNMPDWVDEHCSFYKPTPNLNIKMQFVIEAANKNIRYNTGGPFAAAIFNADTDELVALGVNLVTTQGISILHAEMVAIAIAQKKLGVYDLGGESINQHQLVSSTEPCAMCLGAIPWSGVNQVVTGASDEDARSIGFDEGPKPDDWKAALVTRGISVTDNVERDKASQVLQRYLNSNGHIYNSRES